MKCAMGRTSATTSSEFRHLLATLCTVQLNWLVKKMSISSRGCLELLKKTVTMTNVSPRHAVLLFLKQMPYFSDDGDSKRLKILFPQKMQH